MCLFYWPESLNFCLTLIPTIQSQQIHFNVWFSPFFFFFVDSFVPTFPLVPMSFRAFRSSPFDIWLRQSSGSNKGSNLRTEAGEMESMDVAGLWGRVCQRFILWRKSSVYCLGPAPSFQGRKMLGLLVPVSWPESTPACWILGLVYFSPFFFIGWKWISHFGDSSFIRFSKSGLFRF